MADGFTKTLGATLFGDFTRLLGMSESSGSVDKESMLAMEGYLKSGNLEYEYPEEYYFIFPEP